MLTIVHRESVKGTMSAVNTLQRLGARRQRYKVLSIARQGDSSRHFWGDQFPQLACRRGDRIIVCDIPLPNDHSVILLAQQKMGQLTHAGIEVTILDHLKGNEIPWGPLIDQGARVCIAETPALCFAGKVSPDALLLGRYAAIADRNPLFNDATAGDLETVAGMECAIRDNAALVAEMLDGGDTLEMQEWFRARAGIPIVEPYRIRKIDKVVYAEVDPVWGFKQLNALVEEVDAVYGVGYSPDLSSVIAVRNWRHEEAVPVGYKLGLRSYIGSGCSLRVPVPASRSADAVAWETVSRLLANQTPVGPSANGEVLDFVAALMGKSSVPWYMTDHSWGHIQAVIDHSFMLVSVLRRRNMSSPWRTIDQADAQVLFAASVLHDIGHAKEEATPEEVRLHHHRYGSEMILSMGESGLFKGLLSSRQIAAVADLTLRHRRCEDLPKDPHARYLCLLLRLADALDLTRRRGTKNSFGTTYASLSSKLPPIEVPHWEGHRAILGFRFWVDRDGIEIELVVDDLDAAQFHIDRLKDDLEGLSEFLEVKVTATRVH